MRLAALSVLALPFLAALAPAPSAAGDTLDLAYYLPDGDYDPAVPTPREVLGFEVGEWHVYPDGLRRYLEVLAATSERVSLEVIGHSHEQRPLIHLTITSPANHARLEDIRLRHVAAANGNGGPSPDDRPVVVNLGYSVHGNEASGSNAAVVVAYHLSAARDEETLGLLDEVVIILDPVLNPDGLARFAGWANMHRGAVLVGDPDHREHREAWPNGRTNHYWFDLNRDWLLGQHPESQARLEQFHRWKPNVLTDFHEMGSNSTYFFQPGVESRQNPLTPRANFDLTAKIAEYHAAALDAVGSLYYRGEVFDDFYYGKGSTYPDVNGGIGILFEQASARGHLRETDHGPLSFPFGIRNQVLTSFSSLRAARELRSELLAYQADFFRESLAEAGPGGHVFGDADDPARVFRLVELLRRHQITVHELARPVTAGGETFTPGTAFAVPARQPQARLVEAVFERRQEFVDSTFYDVSAWTLPLTFGVADARVERLGDELLGAEVDVPTLPAGRTELDDGAYAYLFEWSGYYAPRALHRLLAAGVRARVATQPLHVADGDGHRQLPAGTVVITFAGQTVERAEIEELLATAAREDGIDVLAVTTGLSLAGSDLGSPSLRPLDAPRIALVVGSGVATYDAGEIWHLLDHRFRMPVSLVERDRLGNLDLDRYTHLILVDGWSWADLDEDTVAALRGWVRAGGVLVTTMRAAAWAGSAILEHDAVDGEKADGDETAQSSEPVERRPYGDFRDAHEAQLIGGAIFEVELDLTHPLAFGYHRGRLPVLRGGKRILPPQTNPYTTVAAYTAEPLLAGYASAENRAKIAGTPALVADRLGRGTVVRFADDPSFRAVWYGTQKLFLNSLFFAGAIDNTDD